MKSHLAADRKTALIDQLRIDRSDRVTSGGRGWIMWAAIAVLAVLVSVASWYAGARVATAPAPAAAPPAPAAAAPPAAAASTLNGSGYIIARRQATVSAKVTGRVTAVLIEEGQHVEKDQLIARLDDSNTRTALEHAAAQVEQAAANLDAARVAFEDAGPIYLREEQQHAGGLISAQTLDIARAAYNTARAALRVAERTEAVARANLATARQNHADTEIRAPFSGVVTVKAAQAGEVVSPISAGGGFTRTGICTIVDMRSLELHVDVSENFISRVRPRQPVVVRLNAYPDWAIPAEVIAVIPTADRAKATVKVRIGFKQRDPRILPDMGARVSFLRETS